MQLLKMRILITGSSGFVGSKLAPHLQSTFKESDIITVGGPLDKGGIDITNYNIVAQTVETVRPDIIVHLAAVSAVSEAFRSPDLAYNINLGGTLNILRAIDQTESASALIFASSSEIYGRSFITGGALDESAQLAPSNPYAVSKASADLAVQEAAHRGLKAIILRLFNHTGPGQSSEFVLPSFAKQIAEIELGKIPPVLLTGNLEAYRDFMDVTDVLDAYTSVVENVHQLNQCEILNISSGKPRKIKDLLEYLITLSKVEIKVRTDPSRLRPSEIKQAVGNAAYAKKRLRWEPKRPIELTLRSLLEHARIEAEKSS
ncbi:MAG: GDP-mannose 4,6-dehydratase [Pseudomonadota bacterium]